MRLKPIHPNLRAFAWVLFVLFWGAGNAVAQVQPVPAHIVIVIEENHDFTQIIGAGQSVSAPYFNTLANAGAIMTNSHGYSHNSEDNYLAFFDGDPYDGTGVSGLNYGTDSDDCLTTANEAVISINANLGSELLTGGYSFCGFSEDLPSAGSTVCTATGSVPGETGSGFARKHNPWINFQQGIGGATGNLPVTCNQPMTSFQGISNYSTLPTVSFVIPDLWNDMHDGPVSVADTWLNTNLGNYATYCQNPANNSLLIVTWDENVAGNDTDSNRIPTIFYGAMVAPGSYSEQINHYNVLKTILNMYGLPTFAAATSSSVSIISDIFQPAGTATNTATATATATNTPTQTASNTTTNSPTTTATPTGTLTPVSTDTFTSTPSSTATPTSTNTPLNTNTATNSPTTTPSFTPTPTVSLPVPDHIVIVIDSDESYSNILGAGASVTAPYLNSLASTGAVLTNYNGLSSSAAEPNWFGIFSGSTQGATSDACPSTPFTGANLASEMASAGLTFIGYSEGLTAAGSAACSILSGPSTQYQEYVAKHAPWVFFSNVNQTAVGQPFTSFPSAGNFASLPQISIVVPNEADDMREGNQSNAASTITQGDTWINNNLSAYNTWAQGHNSLFIVMFDYAGGSSIGPVPMILNGPMVVPGTYSTSMNHYNLLATLEDMYNLPLTGGAVTATAMSQMFALGPFATVTNTPTLNTPTSTSTSTTTLIVTGTSTATSSATSTDTAGSTSTSTASATSSLTATSTSSPTVASTAGTGLYPGAIALTGALGNGDDQISFVPMTALSAGQTIFFTNEAWDNTANSGQGGLVDHTGSLATSITEDDSIIQYVTGTSVAAYTQVIIGKTSGSTQINNLAGGSVAYVSGAGSTSASPWLVMNNTVDGNKVLAFTSALSAPSTTNVNGGNVTFLAALIFGPDTWTTSGSPVNAWDTYLPPSLNSTTAVDLSSLWNSSVTFTGQVAGGQDSTVESNPSSLLSALVSPYNWSGNILSKTNFRLDSPVSVTNPSAGLGGWNVTTSSEIYNYTPTFTFTSTSSPTATATVAPTVTNSPANTSTATGTGTNTATATLTSTATAANTNTATNSPTATNSFTSTPTACLPKPDHIVILIDSDEPYSNVIGQTGLAPYINSLASAGALLTNYSGVSTAASEPNWFAFFSGTTEGATSDGCPATVGPFSNANLGSELISGGYSFAGYSELLPSAGSTVCTSGTSPTQFVAKHAPWIFFNNLNQSAVDLPFSSFATIGNYANLPTLSIVVPDTTDDMRYGLTPTPGVTMPASITAGDSWANTNLNAYYQWAMGHNSMLIVMFDYGNSSTVGPVPMIINGPMVVPGTYPVTANHYNLLATLEDMYGLALTGSAATAAPLTQMFNCGGFYPTVTNTPILNTATATSSATWTSTAGGGTSTNTATNTSTNTATNTATPTNTGATTAGLTTTETDSATPTHSATSTSTVTSTDTAGNTATSTASAASTGTFSPTGTLTVVPTNTANGLTNTSTNTATSTSTNTATNTTTSTDTAGGNTATPANTSTSTGTVTNTPTHTVTGTVTATFTSTVTGTLTPASTATNTSTSTHTSTNTATSTSTNTSTNTTGNTSTSTFSPTVTPTATSTNTSADTFTTTFTPTTGASTSTPTATAATGLSAGAIALTGALGNGDNQISFVPMTALSAGQTIFFTNEAWDNTANSGLGGLVDRTGSLATSITEDDSIIQYVTGTGVAAYTQVIIGKTSGSTQINNLAGGSVAYVSGAGSTSSTPWLVMNNTVEGNKVLAFTSTLSAPSTTNVNGGNVTFLAALIFGPDTWTASGSPVNAWDTYLPPGLNSTTAVDLSLLWNSSASFATPAAGGQDSAVESNPSSLLSVLVNPYNWSGNILPKSGFRLDSPVSVTNPSAGLGGWNVTTSSEIYNSTPTATVGTGNTATATNTATSTSQSTLIATSTVTPTATNTISNTATTTLTAQNTHTSTMTQTGTIVPPTATNTATVTLTNTSTNTQTVTGTFTSTAMNTLTFTASNTPMATSTPTSTGTPTLSPTGTLQPTNTLTPTYTPTVTSTNTVVPIATAAGTVVINQPLALTLPNGAGVSIGSGILPSGCNVSAAQDSASAYPTPSNGQVIQGSVYNFSAVSGSTTITQFTQPVLLTFTFLTGDTGSQLQKLENSMEVVYLNSSNVWTSAGNINSIKTSASGSQTLVTVTIYSSHFSTWAVATVNFLNSAPAGGSNILAPVPANSGDNICLYTAQTVSSSTWNVYSVAGYRVANLSFTNSTAVQCWNTAGVGRGLYYVKLALQFADGTSVNEWHTVVVK